MEETVQLTIPARWLEDLSIDQEELRQAVMLGLNQLRQQREEQDISDRIIQALLDTGLVHHLSVPLPEGIESGAGRQDPPTLSGPPLSEIIIAQRRGGLPLPVLLSADGDLLEAARNEGMAIDDPNMHPQERLSGREAADRRPDRVTGE